MSELFSGNAPLLTASAPGRMDVMGGIADYSGSLLLQKPIKQTTTVKLQLRKDGLFHCVTGKGKSRSTFTIHYDDLRGKSYSEAGAIIRAKSEGDWAVYIIGCFLVLAEEKNIQISGASVEVDSSIPPGKGVSSSAALEVAVMRALDKALKLQLGSEELSVLAQKAENFVVGAPCGLMDQLSSHLGEKNKLLPLVCQPHQVFDSIRLPSGLQFCGIDSGIRHAVSGASYSDVRSAAFMAYSIIALNAGASTEQLRIARDTGDWKQLPFGGFLANLPVSLFEKEYRRILPERISGEDFTRTYGISIDQVTSVDAGKEYFAQACSQHPVYENFRVTHFRNILQNFSRHHDKQAALTLLGELMLQSHASYSAVGLGNERTDEIVQMAMEDGPAKHIYGARVSGGGSGGTVVLLCYGKEGKQAAKEIYERYKGKYGGDLFFFS